jgi:Uma2 family endonuclease
VILSETTVVQPDLVYVDGAHHRAVSDRGIEAPPTLVVEILSPSTATIDRVTKPRLYARHGVRHLWLVDPEAQALEALVLEPGGYSLAVRAVGPRPSVRRRFRISSSCRPRSGRKLGAFAGR